MSTLLQKIEQVKALHIIIADDSREIDKINVLKIPLQRQIADLLLKRGISAKKLAVLEEEIDQATR
jgi:hypothetical protein